MPAEDNGPSHPNVTRTADAPVGDQPKLRRALEGERTMRGDRIGRFVIEGPLGRGGMGVVLAAHDPDLNRRVAIKLLRGRGVPAQVERLRREAQAAAQLSHPNVVAVFEVGEHDGDTYIAMELVEGRTMSGWLSSGERTWQQIRDAYLAAGRGLAAAHAAGLVHRDVKPSNILMDDERPRLADFGLVRLSETDDDQPASVDLTELSEGAASRDGRVVGTPRYMSPEQRSGDPVDARSDQYSFCLSLYESLTGDRPGGPDEDKGRAPGWLLSAISRGLSDDPDSRYPTTDELLRAIGYTPNRRRWLLAASAGIAIAAATSFVALRAVTKSDRCVVDPTTMHQVWNDQVEAELRGNIGKLVPGNWEAAFARARDRVDGWLDHHRRAAARACAEHHEGQLSAAGYAQSKACLARARVRMATLLDAAKTATKKRDLMRALSLIRTHAKERCQDPTRLLGRKVHLSDEAEALTLELAKIEPLTTLGKLDDAEPLADELLARARALDAPAVLAFALYERAVVASLRRQPKRAEALFREVTTVGAAGGADNLVANAWSRLVSITRRDKGRLEEALTIAGYAESAIARAGNDRAARGHLATETATILQLLGRFEEADAMFRKALKLATEALGEDAFEVGATMHNYGILLWKWGKLAEAEAMLAKSLRIIEAKRGKNHPAVGQGYSNLGAVTFKRGNYAKALEIHQRALSIIEASLGPKHRMTLPMLQNISQVYRKQRKIKPALALLQRALAIQRKHFRPNHPEIARARMLLGVTVLEAERPREARDHCAWAEQTFIAAKWRTGELAETKRCQALALLALGDRRRALVKSRQAVALARSLKLSRSVTADHEWILARALRANGQAARARNLALELRDIASPELRGIINATLRKWRAR